MPIGIRQWISILLKTQYSRKFEIQIFIFELENHDRIHMVISRMSNSITQSEHFTENRISIITFYIYNEFFFHLYTDFTYNLNFAYTSKAYIQSRKNKTLLEILTII